MIQSVPAKFAKNCRQSSLPRPTRKQYHGRMNLGMPEMIAIFFIALIVFGPKRLPEIGRQVGKFMNEFKRASNEFKSQLESEVNKLETEVEATKQQILPPSEPPQGTVASGSAQDTNPNPVISTAKSADA